MSNFSHCGLFQATNLTGLSGVEKRDSSLLEAAGADFYHFLIPQVSVTCILGGAVELQCRAWLRKQALIIGSEFSHVIIVMLQMAAYLVIFQDLLRETKTHITDC